MMALKLLSVTEFASEIAPIIAPVSAVNQLADWRRSRSHYRPCTVHVPRPVKIGNVVMYPESELAKTIAGIAAFKARFPAF